MKQYLLYQYSSKSFNWILKQHNLKKQLKVNKGDIVPISHQKALFFTNMPKKQITRILDVFNKKYDQRIRIN